MLSVGYLGRRGDEDSAENFWSKDDVSGGYLRGKEESGGYLGSKEESVGYLESKEDSWGYLGSIEVESGGYLGIRDEFSGTKWAYTVGCVGGRAPAGVEAARGRPTSTPSPSLGSSTPFCTKHVAYMLRRVRGARSGVLGKYVQSGSPSWVLPPHIQFFFLANCHTVLIIYSLDEY